jgi:hypothetical protein
MWGLAKFSEGFASLALADSSIGSGVYMVVAGAMLAVVGLLGLIVKE